LRCGEFASPNALQEVAMLARRTVILGLAAASFATPALGRGRFGELFDGKTLDGWTPLGDANWTVRDGAICADKGAISFLVSRESYRDFDLRAAFWVSHEANSGIFIRCSDRDRVSATNAYEVNIFDTRPDPAYGTGSIVDVAKVFPMPKAGGRWNLMQVRARGDTFSVVFNGRKTVDSARNDAHAEGPIALQYGAGTVKFRSIAIRTL
jgi:hypothetical protein